MKAKNKELKIGDVVGQMTKTAKDRFAHTGRLRNEAYAMLDGCSRTDKETWADIMRDNKLSDVWGYRIYGDDIVINQRRKP